MAYTNQQIVEMLSEARIEISRINRAAGETVFNPTATKLLDAVIGEFCTGEA